MPKQACKVLVLSEYKNQDDKKRKSAYVEKMARTISLCERKVR